MNAVELIEKHIDVESILEYYNFDHITHSGNYIRSCCALHGGSNPTAFVINVETGLWSCHTGCKCSGNIFQLVQKLEEITFPYAVHKVAEILKLDINNLEIVARNAEEKKELRNFLKTLKKHESKELLEFKPKETPRTLKKYKEFDLSTIEYFKACYYDEFTGSNSKGESVVIKNVVAFPIIKEGVIIGYSLRATKKDAIQRWSHQPAKINTSELLYNYENAIGKSSVVIVEGITDVWAYHEIGVTAVATYGAHITEKQRTLLIQLGADLYFSFDADDAGRGAMKKARESFNLTTNIKFINLPEGHDPASITREELEKAYEQRTNQCIS